MVATAGSVPPMIGGCSWWNGDLKELSYTGSDRHSNATWADTDALAGGLNSLFNICSGSAPTRPISPNRQGPPQDIFPNLIFDQSSSFMSLQLKGEEGVLGNPYSWANEFSDLDRAINTTTRGGYTDYSQPSSSFSDRPEHMDGQLYPETRTEVAIRSETP